LLVDETNINQFQSTFTEVEMHILHSTVDLQTAGMVLEGLRSNVM